MSRQHVVDAIGIIGGMLLAAFWILSLLRQPLSQVSQVLDRDYAAALPVVRQIMGPLPEPVEAEPVVDQRGLGASMGVVAKLTATLKTFMAVYPRLLSVRGFPFAAVFLMGVPLVLAAWQLGAARQRLRLREGRAPNPWVHTRGGLVAFAGPILMVLVPGTLIAGTAWSFGWWGVGGVLVSATGAYFRGMHARRG